MLLTQTQAYNIYYLQAAQRGRVAYAPWEAAALVDHLVTAHDCELTDAIMCVCRGSYNNAPLSKLYDDADWYKDLSSKYRTIMDSENKSSQL